VNWFGISDVADLVDDPNMRTWAEQWIGSQPDRKKVATRVSPLTYVRHGLPPIITIHGDQDPLVPYSQAVRLHTALTRYSVPNKLVTVPDGHHGYFGSYQTRLAFAEIFAFLKDNGLPIKYLEHNP
jgi:acetyl esterase/lipase